MVRFAQMGSAYARVVLGIEHPRVGLLANGTEDEKGSNFTKACFPAMKAAVPGFVGNCEGTDLTSGNFDVVVADGMSGNIALKATEAGWPSFAAGTQGCLYGLARHQDRRAAHQKADARD